MHVLRGQGFAPLHTVGLTSHICHGNFDEGWSGESWSHLGREALHLPQHLLPVGGPKPEHEMTDAHRFIRPDVLGHLLGRADQRAPGTFCGAIEDLHRAQERQVYRRGITSRLCGHGLKFPALGGQLVGP
jgi:hypothetical protein